MVLQRRVSRRTSPVRLAIRTIQCVGVGSEWVRRIDTRVDSQPGLHVPSLPQVSGLVHVPQAMLPPQPSGAVPQFCPAGHDVAGVQPQTPGVPPPPHICGAVQVVPHVPQLLLSVCVSVQLPLHFVCPLGH
jgi:hypothetical protein